MNIKKSTQIKSHAVWALLTWVMVITLVLSGCGSVQQTRVYHVGVLSGLDFFANTFDGFKAGMTDLGYIEGKTIVYDLQKTNFEPDKEAQILKQFVADKVDLIYVLGTEVSISAKAATAGTNIPVLFAQANIEGVDLVDSVRAPGGNITGVRYPGPDLALKRFEILHELVPQAKRILLPYQKGYPNVNAQLDALLPEAETAGVTILQAPANNAAEVQADLTSRANGSDPGMDAILLIAEPLGGTPDVQAVLGKFAYEHKLPFGGNLTFGDYGTVFSISTDNLAVGKQSAPLADKILKGIKAGTIPVVSAESFMEINVKAAQQLGVTVPEGLLSQANQVIK